METKNQEIVSEAAKEIIGTSDIAVELSKKDEMVRFRIAKGSSDKERGPVFVGINGKSYLIQRGITVEMPRAVVEVLENASDQMDYALSYQEMNENRQLNR